jgi:hypothetical protein
MSDHLIAYCSMSLIAPAYADREIADLVAKSIEQNGRYGITGALLHSENRRFAQALEGAPSDLAYIMRKISTDTRHSRIVMLHDGPTSHRRFAGWSLAFRGNAVTIDQTIRAAEYEAALPTERALWELLETMESLVRQS